MKIIDFHTHPGYNTTQKWGYDMTDSLFVEELRRSSIAMAAGSYLDMNLIKSSNSYDELIKRLNSNSWQFFCNHSDFFVPGIHIHPDYVKESCEQIEFYAKKGVVLVGELVPYLMGCDWNSEVYTTKGFMELFDLCNQFYLTVSVHTSTPAECEHIAKTFKNLNLVMAHPAYGDEYFARLDVVKKYDNLFLDLSGTGIASYGMLRYGVDIVGKEKIVFGTDFPIYNPEMYVRTVFYEKMSYDELEHILFKNATKLLKLE